MRLLCWLEVVNHSKNTEIQKKNVFESVVLPPGEIICAGFIFRSDSNGAW